MRRFLLGFVIGVIAVVLGLFVIVVAAIRLASSKQAVVPADAVLLLDLSGGISESSPVELLPPFTSGQGAPTIRDLWSALRAAASDNRIKAVLLKPRDLGVGWGKLAELRRDLQDFKRSGKPVFALLENGGSKEYYLASVADRIYLTPDDNLNVKGFSIEQTFYKNTFDKFGVGIQVDHIGKYKNFGDTFSRSSMTAETREVLNGILDQIYNDFCSSVATARNKKTGDIQSLVDMGPFTADQAKAVGLIDELGYEDQVFTALQDRTKIKKLNRTSAKSFVRAIPAKGDRIAFLVGEGDIIRGDAEAYASNRDTIISGAFAKLVHQVREDTSVRGVIVRVDSPGGDAVASDEILHELRLLSAAKPVVISMSDVAASGGYFMSMTGDPVLAYPNTFTGSIGVVYVRPNFKGSLDKLGITHEILTRGKLADIDLLSEPLSDAGSQKLHDSIQKTYNSFVSKVAAARKRTYNQIEPLSQGRVWMGTRAQQNGLVDDLGGLTEAVAQVRRRAKLDSNGETQLVPFPPRKSLLQILADAGNADALAADAIERKIREQLPALPAARTLRGGMLAVAPFRVDVH